MFLLYVFRYMMFSDDDNRLKALGLDAGIWGTTKREKEETKT